MARPISQRTERTYRRDVEHLTRLRGAVQMDLELDSGIVEQVCAQIDALTASIRQILAGPSIPTEPQKLKKAR